MRLGEDEQKLAEYYFKGAGDADNMRTLTNRRLVVVYQNAEESYPLSKITAIRIIYQRITGLIVLGLIFVFLSLGVFSNNNTLAGLVVLAAGIGMVYWGWQGRTHLRISQMGGHKDYAVRGRSTALGDFMEAVNSKLA